MAERLCVCGHNEDWHRAIICGAARCDCEQYEQTTRIAELEAERDRLREALEKYGTHTMRCSFYGSRTCSCGFWDVLNKADTNLCRHEWYEAGEKCEKCGRAKSMLINTPQEADNA